MITAEFYTSGNTLWGFHVSGHAAYDASGKDIVCAAVSSVSIMAANTITEIHKASARVSDSDEHIHLELTEHHPACEQLLEGLMLFLNGLAQQYPEYLSVTAQERSLPS